MSKQQEMKMEQGGTGAGGREIRTRSRRSSVASSACSTANAVVVPASRSEDSRSAWAVPSMGSVDGAAVPTPRETMSLAASVSETAVAVADCLMQSVTVAVVVAAAGGAIPACSPFWTPRSCSLDHFAERGASLTQAMAMPVCTVDDRGTTYCVVDDHYGSRWTHLH